MGGEFKSDLFIEKVPSQDFYMVGVLEKAKGLGILDSTDLQIDLGAFFPIIVLLIRLLIVIFRGGCQEIFFCYMCFPYLMVSVTFLRTCWLPLVMKEQ